MSSRHGTWRCWPRQPAVAFDEICTDDPVIFRAHGPIEIGLRIAEAIRVLMAVRIDLGDGDDSAPPSRVLSARLRSRGIQHAFAVRAGVAHQSQSLLRAVGDERSIGSDEFAARTSEWCSAVGAIRRTQASGRFRS